MPKRRTRGGRSARTICLTFAARPGRAVRAERGVTPVRLRAVEPDPAAAHTVSSLTRHEHGKGSYFARDGFNHLGLSVSLRPIPRLGSTYLIAFFLFQARV